MVTRRRGDLMAEMLEAMRTGRQRLTHHLFGETARQSFVRAAGILGLKLYHDGTYRPNVGTYAHLERYIALGRPSRYRQTDPARYVNYWRLTTKPHLHKAPHLDRDRVRRRIA